MPIDCDWGWAEAKPWHENLMASWKHGFDITRVRLVPQRDGQSLIVRRSEYHDDSGRKGNDRTEYFAREQTALNAKNNVGN